MENQSTDTASIKETAEFRTAAENQYKRSRDIKEETNCIEFKMLIQEIITDAYCIAFIMSLSLLVVATFVNYVYSHLTFTVLVIISIIYSLLHLICIIVQNCTFKFEI